MTQDPELVIDIVRKLAHNDRVMSQPWGTYALIVRISSESMQMNGFGYVADEPPKMANPGQPDLFVDFSTLREQLVGPKGELWEVAVLRIDRDSGRFNYDFILPSDADQWRVTPATFQAVAEAARPGPESFG